MHRTVMGIALAALAVTLGGCGEKATDAAMAEATDPSTEAATAVAGDDSMASEMAMASGATPTDVPTGASSDH